MLIEADPEKDSLYHISLYAILLAIATIFLALRIYVKLRVVRNIRLEDFALIFALVLSSYACSIQDNVSHQSCHLLTGKSLSYLHLLRMSPSFVVRI